METNLPSPYCEIWSPILTIAKILGEEIFQRILNFAREMVKEKEEEVYKEEYWILTAIEKLFNQQTKVGEEGKEKLKLLEFTISELWSKLKELLVVDKEELSEKEFESNFKKQRLGLILNRMGIGKRRKTGGQRVRVIFSRYGVRPIKLYKSSTCYK